MTTDIEQSNAFKLALKLVLKKQVKSLLYQLEEAGEEVVVMSVNIEDRTCQHFGSPVGEGFISEQQHLTNNFLNYCVKKNNDVCSRLVLNLSKEDISNLPDTQLLDIVRKMAAKPSGKSTADNKVQGQSQKRLAADMSPLPLKKICHISVSPVTPSSSPGSRVQTTRSGRKIQNRFLEDKYIIGKKPSATSAQAKPGPQDSSEGRHESPKQEKQETNGTRPVNTKHQPENSNSSSPSIDFDVDLKEANDESDEDIDNDIMNPDIEEIHGTEEENDNIEAASTADLGSKAHSSPIIRKGVGRQSVGKVHKRTKKKHRSYAMEPYLPCPQCGILLRGKCGVQNHVKQVHEKLKNCSCAVCGKGFFTKLALEDHTLSVHTRKCSSCEEYVVENMPWDEGINMRMVRNIICNCGNIVPIVSLFGRKTNIVSADSQTISMGEGVSREKTKYACGTCGKLYTRKDSCEQHAQTHLETKPFVCEICGSSFSYANSLKRHLRKVHDHVDLICRHCKKPFCNEISLKVHVSKFHGDVVTDEVTIAQPQGEAVSVQQLMETSDHVVLVTELPDSM